MTTSAVPSSVEPQVQIWAPIEADAEILCTTLERYGIKTAVCASADELSRAVHGGAAAAVIAEEALTEDALSSLRQALSTQPEWSDFPVLIVVRDGGSRHSDRLTRVLDMLGQATLLERPMRTLSLVSSIRVALRSRERQYQLRDRIRELHDTAVRLKDAEKRALSAARAKSEFVATMSHEIRTPMTAILGYAEILSDSLGDSTHHKKLETIRRNGKYLLELLNDILDLSKIEAGRLPLTKARVSPWEMLEEVCELMEVRAAERGLKLELECKEPIPETIETDRKRLRQVLINIMGNAVKFTESGGIRVECKLARATRGPRLQIQVTDTGIGMTPSELAEAFEPFSRAGAGRARKVPGTGLGLSISKRLVDLLGGELDARSTPGKGSTFVIRIPTGPLDGVPLSRHQQRGPESSRPAGERAISGRLDHRILVVDDDRDLRDLARHFLQQAGARVASAEHGEEALAKFDASRRRPSFDAVILDMQMPVLDGYRTAKALRERRYQGPIVALTAAVLSGDREQCLRAGCDEHIVKPIHWPSLVDTLSRLIRSTPQRKPEACRLLLVEDDPDVRRSFEILLKKAGHEVEVASDGGSALERARTFVPDAVLLDIGLPDRSGHEVARGLRTCDALANVLIIGLTGEDADPAAEDVFDAYLLKPASVADVERVLATRTHEP